MKKIRAAYFALGTMTGFTVAVGLAFHSLIPSGQMLQPWIFPLCFVTVAGAAIVGRMSKAA